eukprot:296913-Chlamydomonas_euryale.AAC.5
MQTCKAMLKPAMQHKQSSSSGDDINNYTLSRCLHAKQLLGRNHSPTADVASANRPSASRWHSCPAPKPTWPIREPR